MMGRGLLLGMSESGGLLGDAESVRYNDLADIYIGRSSWIGILFDVLGRIHVYSFQFRSTVASGFKLASMTLSWLQRFYHLHVQKLRQGP